MLPRTRGKGEAATGDAVIALRLRGETRGTSRRERREERRAGRPGRLGVNRRGEGDGDGDGDMDVSLVSVLAASLASSRLLAALGGVGRS